MEKEKSTAAIKLEYIVKHINESPEADISCICVSGKYSVFLYSAIGKLQIMTENPIALLGCLSSMFPAESKQADSDHAVGYFSSAYTNDKRVILFGGHSVNCYGDPRLASTMQIECEPEMPPTVIENDKSKYSDVDISIKEAWLMELEELHRDGIVDVVEITVEYPE